MPAARPPAVLAASLLAADFARLGEEAVAAVDAGAAWIHLDVMDNHYVPNLTFGPAVCAALRRQNANYELDAHLMTEPVDSLIAPFADAGANGVTFHPDACRHPARTLAAIKARGLRAGLAFNPASPLSALDYAEDADLILIMTVNPGFGGQQFLPAMLKKIKAARALLDARQSGARLQVDGGINPQTAAQCKAAGADVFVAGNALFADGKIKENAAALLTAIGDE